jgi:cytochrome c oxidase assembly protein subunit 11
MAQHPLKKENRKLTWQLWLFAAGFLGFGFALVPLYNVLCDVTGYGDRSKLQQAASVIEAPDDTRTITIEFLSSVPTYGSWEFRAERAQIQVHPGRLYEANLYARNLRVAPVIAQAIPSIAPLQATQYFHKTECFCFRPQPFGGQEARELSVRFIVDAKLPATIDRLTLAYAMYDSKNTSG